MSTIMKLIKKTAGVLREEKGSYILEASVTLPFVLLAIVTITGFIALEQTKENIYSSSCDEMRYAMINSYVYRDELILPGRLEKRLEEENGGRRTSVSVRGYSVGNEEEEVNDIIKIIVTHRTDMKMPFGFGSDNLKYYKFAGRKFTGDTERKSPAGFSMMEQYGTDNVAYVFPYSGDRYHKQECSYTSPAPEAAALTSSLRDRYDPCSLCNSRKKNDGEVVYVFPAYGMAYHCHDCATIKKKSQQWSVALLLTRDIHNVRSAADNGGCNESEGTGL